MDINVYLNNGGGAQLETVSAVPENVLNGVTYNDSEGEVQTGTMTNRGSTTCTLGYASTYTGSSGYYQSISVTSPGRYGNATQAQVLSGRTFMNSSGNYTGTMSNYGDISQTINFGKTYSGSSGYYKSISITANSLSGTATAAQVLSGKTFMNSSGLQTGSMPTQTPSATTVPNGSTVTGSAGYYSAFTIKGEYKVNTSTVALTGAWYNSGLKYTSNTTVYYGAHTENESTSFKVVISNSYLWATKNAGSNCDIYFITVDKT